MAAAVGFRERIREELIDADFPELDAILAIADMTTRLPVRDFTGADWSDTSGDHRWRSLDAAWEPPSRELAGWE